MNKKTTEIYFYFDSKNIFTILVKNQIPEIYECFDKGDEFECWIKVENSGSLKTFLKHFKSDTYSNKKSFIKKFDQYKSCVLR